MKLSIPLTADLFDFYYNGRLILCKEFTREYFPNVANPTLLEISTESEPYFTEISVHYDTMYKLFRWYDTSAESWIYMFGYLSDKLETLFPNKDEDKHSIWVNIS